VTADDHNWKAVAVKRAEQIAQLKATLARARAVLAELDQSEEPRSHAHVVDALRMILR
jgi:hypothetical protein